MQGLMIKILKLLIMHMLSGIIDAIKAFWINTIK